MLGAAETWVKEVSYTVSGGGNVLSQSGIGRRRSSDGTRLTAAPIQLSGGLINDHYSDKQKCTRFNAIGRDKHLSVFDPERLGRTAPLVGAGAIWIAGRLLRELAAEGKA